MDRSHTIRTLAKMASVSNATISLALRNHPRISRAERERIQRIAAEAGYRSNPLVANLLAQLRSSKTATYQSTLGLVYVGKDPRALSVVPTFRDWIKGCEERASQLGYRIDRFSVYDPEVAPERLTQILRARNIAGLVIIGPFEHNVIPPEFAPLWRATAAIIIGVRPVQPALTFVSNDQFSTAAQAVREVTQLGYERPGLCINPRVDDFVEDRFSGGFLVEQRKLPLKNRLPVFEFAYDSEERFAAWIGSERPDVIITLHAEIEPWLKSMGLRIPGDVGLVHLDKSPNMEGWAGMQQNNELVGRAAVDMVVGQLHRNELGPPPFQKCMFVSGTWVPGRTVRAPEKRRRGNLNRRKQRKQRGPRREGERVKGGVEIA